ncbi:M15 family metallopeptidase [Nocardia uniformis]|uniref:M15 family metallopeptidase n=2 Tax=Nocardia uniformis TaxID=53432 RepID=A0A849CD54_9NOCA|nr:M15 family metallopeptidase [Nocardia uniformis]
MNPSEPATRRLRSTALAALAIVSAASIGVLMHQSLPSPSSVLRSIDILGGDHQGPPGARALDEGNPSLANLDPDLLRALRAAATDAADDGIELVVNSGWRSAEYQEQLLRDAVSKYGSETAAARWVATPATSAHVTGDAVDIGPTAAATWLSEHGAGYGLCQIYANEPWHFELRPEADVRGCPRPYADPTHDPRRQQQ